MLPYLIAAAVATAIVFVATRSSARGGGSASMPSCRTDISAHLTDGRARVKPTLIVLHSTEGSSASSAAGWFAHPDSQGSTHMIVGEDGCYRTLPDEANAAGAGTVNPRALQIEFTGYAKWSRAEWLAKSRTMSSGRAIVQSWARTYGIPLRHLTHAELRAGRSGVATHDDVSKVFGGTHWDPGPNFPIDVVIS
jgi:N-acetyl-anhydromuramyl-L-alanine amidase AmpD